MKPKHSTFAVALLATFTLSGAVAQACDKCQPACSKCKTSVACDDQGLLSVVDRFAGRLQSGVKASLPKINLPKLKSGCNCSSGSCDQGPSCGCESVSAACDHCGSESTMQIFPEPPRIGPHQDLEPWMPVRSTPSQLHEVNPTLPTPMYEGTQPGRVVPTPAPLPAPDSKVDPFLDDAAGRMRSTPARTIQYSKPSNRYRESYDPQAFNGYRVRLSDDGPTAEVVSRDRQDFRTVESSRRSSALPAAMPARDVVTASARMESTPAPIRSTAAQRLQPAPPAESYYANPLRSNH